MRNVERRAGWATVLALAFSLSFAAFHFIDVGTAPAQYQWDLKTYYYAGKACEADLSPYKKSNLGKMAGRRIGLRFFYPPVVLPVVRALAFLTLNQAYALFLLLKAVALAFLVGLWATVFIERGLRPWFFIFAAIAFDATAFIDVRTGNVSIFEQALIWSAMALLVRGRTRSYCALIVLVATAKLHPLLFLVLPPILYGKSKWKESVAFAAAFVAVQVASVAIWPELYRDFLANFSGLGETGMVNPCIFSVMKDVGARMAFPDSFPFLAYEFIALAIVVSYYLVRQRLGRDAGNVVQAALFTLACALILPRFKDYSYLLLIAPAFILCTRMVNRKMGTLFAVLFCLPGPHGLFPPGNPLAHLLPDYQVLFITVAFWLCLVLLARFPAEASGPGQGVYDRREL